MWRITHPDYTEWEMWVILQLWNCMDKESVSEINTILQRVRRLTFGESQHATCFISTLFFSMQW